MIQQKKCTRCKTSKPLEYFSKKVSHPDGLQYQCRACLAITAKTWPSNTRERRRPAEQRYRLADVERRRRQVRESRKRNPESTRMSCRKSHAKSIQKLEFRLASNLRRRLIHAIKNNQKAGAAVGDLGCTIPEFKAYLEGKFLPGMTWDNWGVHGWHIDHICPLASFDLSDRIQFLSAAHFSNMQPLWSHINLSKGATYGQA